MFTPFRSSQCWLVVLWLFSGGWSSGAAAELDPARTSAVEKRVENLLGQLTLEEKFRLLGGASSFQTAGVEGLGIPSLRMSDGPFGVRDLGPDKEQRRGTVYAGGMALAASWDVRQARQVGTALGREARARGIHILLAPGVNLYRAPFCGRNWEYFGEDPLLTGRLAADYIAGLQSQGVAATLKHFVANEQEFDRDHLSSDVDERTLRELYLKPFEMAIKASRPWCVMNSYNPINGLHATANDWLNNQILKGEWGFQGLLMSDWRATHETLGAARGGLDMEMPGPPKYFTAALLGPLLKTGALLPATLDDKVRRLLRVIVALGFLDRPQLDATIPRDDPASAAVALTGAREGLVLLKNQDHFLPLNPAQVKKIVVLGHNAEPVVAVGGGSGHADYLHGVSVWQGLRDEAAPGTEVVRVPWSILPDGTDFTHPPKTLAQAFAYTAYGAGENPELPAAYLGQIQAADLVVMCVGYNDNIPDYWSSLHVRPETEGEAADRTYELPPGQEKMLLAAAKLNPRMVVILNAGGSVATTNWLSKIPVLLDAFYPGQAGGTALAEIIFGKTNPSGKLPFSWEKRWEDAPAFGNYPTKENGGRNRYAEGVFLGYRGFDSHQIEPLFPFGFGLSYATFQYSHLQVRVAADGSVTASFSIKNTSSVAGEEVAQLYVAPPLAQTPRPVHELKSFTRISLPPGAEKSVTLVLAKADLAYWEPASKKWTVTPGVYTAQVGSSSRSLPLQAHFSE